MQCKALGLSACCRAYKGSCGTNQIAQRCGPSACDSTLLNTRHCAALTDGSVSPFVDGRFRLSLAVLQLADEHWGVIGLEWKEASCDKLGEVSGDGGNDSKGDDSSDKGDNSQSGSDKLDGHDGWDTTWLKHKVRSWGSKVDDSDFEKRWEDTVDGTWLSKFKSEQPSWVK